MKSIATSSGASPRLTHERARSTSCRGNTRTGRGNKGTVRVLAKARPLTCDRLATATRPPLSRRGNHEATSCRVSRLKSLASTTRRFSTASTRMARSNAIRDDAGDFDSAASAVGIAASELTSLEREVSPFEGRTLTTSVLECISVRSRFTMRRTFANESVVFGREESPGAQPTHVPTYAPSDHYSYSSSIECRVRNSCQVHMQSEKLRPAGVSPCLAAPRFGWADWLMEIPAKSLARAGERFLPLIEFRLGGGTRVAIRSIGYTSRCGRDE